MQTFPFTIICKVPNQLIGQKCLDCLTSVYPDCAFTLVSDHVLVHDDDVTDAVKNDMEMLCLGVGIQLEKLTV